MYQLVDGVFLDKRNKLEHASLHISSQSHWGTHGDIHIVYLRFLRDQCTCRCCVHGFFIESTKSYTVHSKSYMYLRGYEIKDVGYLVGSGQQDVFSSCC